MKTNRGLILIFTSLLLAGCTASGTADTATLAPSATAKATKIPTPEPSKTPLPTRKPTATPITHIDVPDWLGDPDVNVLLINTGKWDGPNTISHFNANTGEIFDIPMVLNVLAYFWMPDGNSSGLLSRDKQTITLIDTSSGEIIHYPVDDEMTKFYALSGNVLGVRYNFQFPLLAQGDSPLEDDFLLSEREYIWGYEYDPISPDGRFLIRVEPENFRYTDIVDLDTGDINRITKANDKYYDVDYRWIPGTNYLSIVQRDAHPIVGREDRLIRENKLIAHRIIIYDVIKRSIVTYFNNVNNLEWSPDYTQILYDSGGRKFYQDDYHFGGTPCIFNILTGETECLTYIRNHHGSQLLQDFTWSPDGTKISYTYAGFTSDPYFEPGGLCIAVLKTRSISCPTDPIFELGVIDTRSLYVISHSWAPNSKHLALTAVYCMPCDNTQAWKRLIILSADGSYYHDLGLTYETSGLFPGLWRPPITD